MSRRGKFAALCITGDIRTTAVGYKLFAESQYVTGYQFELQS